MITLISFSGRKNGNCDRIVDYIISKLDEKEINVFKFSEKNNIHPCGHCDYRCLKEQGACVYRDDIETLYHYLHESDFSYWIIPNYSDVPCANYFIFRERGQSMYSKYPIYHKKKHFIVISNTEQETFYHLLKNECDTHQINIDFLGSQMVSSKSINGDLVDFPLMTKLLNKMLIKDGLNIKSEE